MTDINWLNWMSFFLLYAQCRKVKWFWSLLPFNPLSWLCTDVEAGGVRDQGLIRVVMKFDLQRSSVSAHLIAEWKREREREIKRLFEIWVVRKSVRSECAEIEVLLCALVVDQVQRFKLNQRWDICFGQAAVRCGDHSEEQAATGIGNLPGSHRGTVAQIWAKKKKKTLYYITYSITPVCLKVWGGEQIIKYD